jgi:fumarate reductase subunit D
MAHNKRTVEPFLWMGFSGGGVVAALTLPVLLFLLGVAIPLGWIEPPDYGHMQAVLTHPLTRLGLVVISAMALVHAAHRLRFTLHDGLKLHKYDPIIAAVCYGGALAGAAIAAYVMFVVV